MADRSTDSPEENALVRAFAWLSAAVSANDRLAALSLALDEAGGDARDDMARLFARVGHLVARGGAAPLLREALAYPLGSAVRPCAEAAVRAPGAPDVRLVRRASTRPFDDGKLRTIETGGSNAGGVQLSSDGARLYTFVNGSMDWLDGDVRSRFQMWSTLTGELLLEQPAGQFREDNGSVAVSPDERTVAVRDHRYIEICDLDVERRTLRRRCVLRGSEGPYMLTFLDERRLVADDSSFELVLWDTATGERLAAAPSVGWHAHVPIAGNTRLLVAGCIMKPGRMIGSHALPSLAEDGLFSAPVAARARSESIAVSPSQRLVATGDDQRAVVLWPLAELRDEGNTSSVRSPIPVTAYVIGEHGGERGDERCDVTCVRFIDEDRLMSGDWYGGLKQWNLAGPERAAGAARPLCGHSASITGIAIHPDRRFVATSAADGLIFLWDLGGDGQLPPRLIPPYRVSRELTRQADGLSVVTDGVSLSIPLPADLALSAAPAPQDPELVGINLGGDLFIAPIHAPGPPQLQLRRGSATDSELIETLELDDHAAGLCALDERTFAVVIRGHVDFYQLR